MKIGDKVYYSNGVYLGEIKNITITYVADKIKWQACLYTPGQMATLGCNVIDEWGDGLGVVSGLTNSGCHIVGSKGGTCPGIQLNHYEQRLDNLEAYVGILEEMIHAHR